MKKELKYPGDSAQMCAMRQTVRVVVNLLRDTHKATPETERVLFELIDTMKPAPIDGWAFEEFEEHGRMFERVVRR